MLPKNLFRAGVVATALLAGPANADPAEDFLRTGLLKTYDLRAPGVYSEPAVEMWKDLLDKANTELQQDTRDALTRNGPVPPGQLVTGYVFGREFRKGDTTIIASIYRANDSACDNGPNTSTSTQTWATCPARVKVIDGSNSRVVEGTVCATTEGVGLEGKAALQTNNFAMHVPDLGVYFNVYRNGKLISECTKEVRYGIFPEQQPEPETVDFVEASPPPAGPVTTVYSETQGKTCRQTASESELSEWICSAPGGREVLFGDTGNIAIVRFGAPTNTKLEPEFRLDGDVVGKKIEWRMRDGKPFATILRFFVRDDNDKSHQVLVVTKIDGKNACHMAYVNARIKDANRQAAEIADTKAHAFKCGTHRPIKVGNPPKWWGE